MYKYQQQLININGVMIPCCYNVINTHMLSFTVLVLISSLFVSISVFNVYLENETG